MRFFVVGSFMKALRVFCGQFRPDSRIEQKGTGKPESVYRQASRVATKDNLRSSKRNSYIQDEI